MQGPVPGAFVHLLDHTPAHPCGVTLAFPSGEIFTVAPAVLWLAKAAGRSGFPGDAQRSQEAANREIPQDCKSRFGCLFPDILQAFFTSCPYQCCCGLNRKLRSGGDGRNVSTDKGGLQAEGVSSC